MHGKARTTVRYIACLTGFMVCFLGILLLAFYMNAQRNIYFISNCTRELTKATASHVSDVLEESQNTIRSISYLYGQSISSPEADLTLLRELETTSGFDWIRFVDGDGIDYASNGAVADVSDRAYFRRGMEGNSGVCAVLASRVNGEKQIGFYAPVWYEEKICGVMVGFLSQSTLSNILKTDLYGYPAPTAIVQCNGTILGQYQAPDAQAFEDIGGLAGMMSASQWKQLSGSLSAQESFVFRFRETGGSSAGALVPIRGTAWSLIQLFPTQAASMLNQRTNADGLLVLTMALLVFLLFLGIFYRTYRQEKTREAVEAGRSRVNTLLRGLADDYQSIVDVDIRKGTEERFRLGMDPVLPDWAEEDIHYDTAVAEYARAVVAEKDRARFLECNRLDTLQYILSKQKSYYMEYDAVVNGELRRYQQKCILSGGSDCPHVLISIRDITETNRELERAKEAAEAANRAKTMFLFNMSHDIRTPMNAILGFAELIERHRDDPQKLVSYTRNIRQAGDYLMELINSVLEMARIESGSAQLQEEPGDIGEILEGMRAVLGESFAGKGIGVKSSVEVNHTWIYVDRTKAQEIHMNILSNALKYTPEGGSVFLSLRELPDPREGWIVLETVVRDTGIGISPEFLPHIFESFSREKSVTENKIPGTGLGLGIVKRYVELMGGAITVESRQGEGTTVTVRIPHRIAEPPVLREPAAEEGDLAGKRILLAEDNALNAEIARELLNDFGVASRRAENGRQCVKALEEAEPGEFDMILMDIQMPFMDGLEATRRIRALADPVKASIPIVAMTANAFDEDRQRCLEAGMNDHLGKPIDPEILKKTLLRYLL